MSAKIKACDKLQQVETQRRDRVGQQLDNMRQQHRHIEQKLVQLSALRDDKPRAHAEQGFNSAALMNHARVDHMLQKWVVHSQQEQAVLEAQCHRMQKELCQRQAKVLGLETTLERWKAKQNYEKARKEQRHLEELINARVRKREW
ncbi:flagellar export protein FliJ [Vibrio sp. SM6]|uniref:Flagellar FliJ protein n=1 Tax=Vibrio agarilyticus TaxID=2726741 RepID=A0A7X8TSB6_9VIBR|nr:flagellar export protein FliJ [Vibrio agarilyticus]NLS13697.1 flagellar export protein FliJ [Vibrio agarilyticus]